MMTRYKNLGGNSNVISYEIGIDYIKVQFSSGSPYEYSYRSAGASNVERAKILAQNGCGLNSFIMTNMRKLYERKTA